MIVKMSLMHSCEEDPDTIPSLKISHPKEKMSFEVVFMVKQLKNILYGSSKSLYLISGGFSKYFCELFFVFLSLHPVPTSKKRHIYSRAN